MHAHQTSQLVATRFFGLYLYILCFFNTQSNFKLTLKSLDH